MLRERRHALLTTMLLCVAPGSDTAAPPTDLALNLRLAAVTTNAPLSPAVGDVVLQPTAPDRRAARSMTNEDSERRSAARNLPIELEPPRPTAPSRLVARLDDVRPVPRNGWVSPRSAGRPCSAVRGMSGSPGGGAPAVGGNQQPNGPTFLFPPPTPGPTPPPVQAPVPAASIPSPNPPPSRFGWRPSSASSSTSSGGKVQPRWPEIRLLIQLTMHRRTASDRARTPACDRRGTRPFRRLSTEAVHEFSRLQIVDDGGPPRQGPEASEWSHASPAAPNECRVFDSRTAGGPTHAETLSGSLSMNRIASGTDVNSEIDRGTGSMRFGQKNVEPAIRNWSAIGGLTFGLKPGATRMSPSASSG